MSGAVAGPGAGTTVQAVLFDWGGTLTPWHTVDALAGWTAAVGDPALGERLLAAEQAVWLRSMDEHRSATLDDVFAAAGSSHGGDAAGLP